MQPTNLSPGFSTIDEAVRLIQSDTRKNPVVDMDYIAQTIIPLKIARRSSMRHQGTA